MTLEDFFTLTEIKDGLTAPGRVEELVTVMQKEKDYVVKNVGDATSKWSTVASTIAATENKDCLDLFIRLDGLWFIDRWLKDAQKFGNDISDSFVEESITALLRALEKLHIDNEKSISSGIWITVKNLLGHNSSRVQERARVLFDSWKQCRDGDAVHQDLVKVEACCDDDGTTVGAKHAGESAWSECCAMESKGSANEGSLKEPSRDEILPSRSSDGQPESVEDVHIETCNNPVSSLITLDCADIKDGSPDALGSSAVLDPVQENLPIKAESPSCPVDGTTPVETGGSPVLKQATVEGKLDVSKLNELTDDGKQTDKINSSPEQLGEMDIPSASSTLEPRAVSSSASAANAEETTTEPALQNNIDTKDGDFCLESAPLVDERTSVSEAKNEKDNNGVLNHCTNELVVKSTGQGSDCYSSGNECTSGRPEDPEASFSRMEDIGAVDDDKEHASDGDEDLTNASDFSKPAMGSKGSNVIDKRSDIELEYDMVDALEVARQVAKEVVGDYREPFGSSSSEKSSEGLIGQPGSPDSINGKHSQSSEAQPKEAPAGQNHSAESSPKGERHLFNSDNRDTELENCIHDIESSQATEMAQKLEVNPEKGTCDFDLNQEICSDDVDRPVNPISTPVSVVSASRAAAVPGLPVAPLQFEGTLGWKGSAATSAFRPASPRRIPDGGEKVLSVGGSSSSSKQRQDCLDIDLNVAEGGDDRNADLILGKQIPVSSGLPSGESSVEASPRRSERLKLDLNRIGDDGDAPPMDWRMEGRLFYHRNGHRSPSPASSSSSMQPCMRNIDLNDRPSIQNDSSDQQPYLGKSSSQYVNAYGGLKPVDPVISIMGRRVEVNRKDIVPTTSFLPNGKALEPAMDGSVGRTGGVLGVGPTGSYAHHSIFGFNGLTAGPTMSFTSAMYGSGGSIPCMVDSRGTPVVPQIVSSASAVPPSYSQPPFIMSMTGTPPGLNGAGPSRPHFDLNSGFMIEGGNRDSGSLRQLFIPGQGRLMEEPLRANPQPSSSSGIGGKRKEPDSGLETYPFNYKHHQPPWK
ncbi:hypothetical protein L1049_026394 [Liquidambar formosana]|uniref:TFIIS N-terminal domain-containing protein n=1 Tax=Liquidambar formosana TaxID=63359 RepID=A0AAP0R7A1_LIQFO